MWEDPSKFTEPSCRRTQLLLLLVQQPSQDLKQFNAEKQIVYNSPFPPKKKIRYEIIYSFTDPFKIIHLTNMVPKLHIE